MRTQIGGLEPHELTPLNHEWAAALVDEYGSWVSRSVAYDKLDRPDDCVRCLDKAINIDGSNIALFRYRANTRYSTGTNLDLAIADCNYVLKVEPRDAETLMVRAEIYLKLGDTTRANADEARAEAIEPGIRERWNQPDDGDEPPDDEDE